MNRPLATARCGEDYVTERQAEKERACGMPRLVIGRRGVFARRVVHRVVADERVWDG
jgi:hypothetical protein